MRRRRGLGDLIALSAQSAPAESIAVSGDSIALGAESFALSVDPVASAGDVVGWVPAVELSAPAVDAGGVVAALPSLTVAAEEPAPAATSCGCEGGELAALAGGARNLSEGASLMALSAAVPNNDVTPGQVAAVGGSAGVPWWVWALGGVAALGLVLVVTKKKKDD